MPAPAAAWCASGRSCATVLNVPEQQCRAVCGDMGGNFGTRNSFFPEYALLPWAARRVGRPVKWYGDRTECFVSDFHGRDLTVSAELALDADGKFLGLRGTNLSNVGAYTAQFVPLRKGLNIMSGVYRIPAVHFRGCAVMTHTMPTTPYRSAGRPEAIYVIERLVDLAAEQCGFDRVALRRRNLIPPMRCPTPTASASPTTMANTKRAWMRRWRSPTGRASRRARPRSRARGMLRGIGFANYIEATGGFPRERAEVTVAARGAGRIGIGTMNSGQGHETSFAQLLTEWLGVPFESVDFVAHDTDRVVAGGGSHSARSMRIASLAIGTASDAIIEKGRAIAAHLLEVSAIDVEFARGVLCRAREPTAASASSMWRRRRATRNDLPEELRGKLDGGRRRNRVGRRVSLRHACLRGRDRPRDRPGAAGAVCRASTMSAARSIR